MKVKREMFNDFCGFESTVGLQSISDLESRTDLLSTLVPESTIDLQSISYIV